jgi:hypothetical protein
MTARTGIRDRDRHASWREVYSVLHVPTDQHGEEVGHG